MYKTAQKGNALILIIAVALLTLTTLFYFKTKPVIAPNIITSITPTSAPSSTTTSDKREQIKTFTSKKLKFMIEYNSNFTIQDNGSSVDLVSNVGKITIIRNGTNLDNLNGYITEFDNRRKSIVMDPKELSINGYKALSRIIKFYGENITQKSYYIYVLNSVYILSTTSESLYNDLDKIAQSFKYNP